MTCLHNHDQILEFLRKIFLNGFQVYQNYLCALSFFSLSFYCLKNYQIILRKTLVLGNFMYNATAYHDFSPIAVQVVSKRPITEVELK